jgi:beta-lactamase class D
VFFAACSTNNVTIDDGLGRLFDSAGVRGDFGLFDNGQGRFTIYNLTRFRDSMYPAGQTFDVLQALIAFQTGVVKDQNAVATGVGASITYAQAMKDRGLTGDTAFQRLADLIGIDTLKKWVDSLKYGDKNIRVDSGHVLIRDVRINADQELGLMKKLYFGQLPFFKRSQELVRDMMTKEANSNYKLVYKTGSAATAQGDSIGWVMGWVEENGHPYFFVLNVEARDGHADVENIGIQLAKRILAGMGYFQGKK